MSIFNPILLPLSLLLSGCQMASNLLDKSIYPKNHNYQNSTQLLNQCNLKKVAEIIQKNKNDFLKNSEEGLLAYYRKQPLKSNQSLDRAIESYRVNESEALVDVSSLLKQEYSGEEYDKVFLHNYKAINYLILGDSQSARVEARNANLFQSKAYFKFQSLIKQNKNQDSPLLSRYQKLFQSVNPQHQPYQNPFAYYISALSYAEDEDYDNALIDIRKALNLLPNSQLLEQKLALYQTEKPSKSIEIFFDVGQSPLKTQVQLEMKMANGEKRMATLPNFVVSKSDIEYIEIKDKHQKVVAKSFLLTDINAIKINEFKEKLPSLFSLIFKDTSLSVAIQSFNNKSNNLLTGLLKTGVAIYSQHDLGTFSLLPQKILVASFQGDINQKYTAVAYSKQGKKLSTYFLPLHRNNLKKNSYQHFLLRENKLCHSN